MIENNTVFVVKSRRQFLDDNHIETEVNAVASTEEEAKKLGDFLIESSKKYSNVGERPSKYIDYEIIDFFVL